jgi:hypothetical protein
MSDPFESFNATLAGIKANQDAEAAAAAAAAQKQIDDEALRNKLGVLPIGPTPMDLAEVNKAWPGLADKHGTFFTKDPGQSPVIRSGGSEKAFHPRGIEQYTDPKTGQNYERRTFYTVPSGAQLPNSKEYPTALAQKAFDPFSKKTVTELLAIPEVQDRIKSSKWAAKPGDNFPAGRSFSDLSIDEADQAVLAAANSIRNEYYDRHYPSHTIAGNWAPVGDPKPQETEHMPGGWWGARMRSIGGAFQNGLSGLNAISPVELVPGMDGRQKISEAMQTFQHMNTRLPSHESTRKATERLMRLSSPEHTDNPNPKMQWVPMMPQDREDLPPTEIQMVAENKTSEWLKMQRRAGATYKASDGTEKTFNQLSPDDQAGVTHEMLRSNMAAEIDRRSHEARAWEGLQAENARPVKDAGIMLDVVNAGVGFLPTAAAMAATGGFAGEAAIGEHILGTGLRSIATTLPFSAGAYQHQASSPYNQIERTAQGNTALSQLYAIQAMNDAAASGKGMNYDQLVTDSKLRGAGAALGTAAAAPLVGAASNKIIGAVLPRAQGVVSDMVNRVSPLKMSAMGDIVRPSFLVNSPALGLANGATKFAVNTAANAATMPIFPIAERAGESLMALDPKPITDLPALGHDISSYAGLGATFGPYSFLHGKLNQAMYAEQNPGAKGAFEADPRWFPDFNGVRTENPQWTKDPRFLLRGDPWNVVAKNQLNDDFIAKEIIKKYPDRASPGPYHISNRQTLGPQSTEAARKAYYAYLESILGAKPPRPGLGGP